MNETPLETGAGSRSRDRVRSAATRALSRAGEAGPEAAVVAAQPQVGPYRLAERLGEGGMGVVHLGLDERGRAVAVKVLRDHVAHDPSARTRLAREFDTLRRVRHERVAPVLDVDIDGDHPYLVTRYVPGPPLDQWVREQGVLGRDHLIRLARGLAEALDAIHEAGVVHRDLKPGNVLIVDGDPVVIDFGIAHVADDVRLTSTGLVMGTPGYLPPELLDGADVDEATDWWGWAATLTYAATGRDPFGKGPLDAIFHRVYRGDADLRGVDPGLAALLSRAFDPDPSRRPGFTPIMTALEDLASGRAGAPGATGVGAAPGFAATEALAVGSSQAEPVTQVVGAESRGASATRSFSGPAGDPGRGRDEWVSRGGAAPTRSGPATRPHQVVATRSMPRVATPEPSPASSAPASSSSYVGFGPPAGHSPAWGSEPDPVGRPAGGGFPGAGGGVGGAQAHASGVGFGGSSVAPPLGSGQVPRRPRRVAAALVALLAVLVAMAASMPVLACFLAVGWAVLARSLHASVLSVLLRREVRGPHPGDVPRALLAWPLRLIPAALSTVLVVLFTGIAAVLAALATAAVQETTYGAANGPLGDVPLAVGMLVGILLGWWGPAGSSLRHGSRVAMRAVVPGRWGVLVVTVLLWLVAVYFALRSQASGIGASLWPLPADLLSTFQLGF